MNVKQLKQLLKESVREVIREELPVLLLENQVRVQKLNESIELKSNTHVEPWNTIKKNSNDVMPVKTNLKPASKGTIFDDLIADAGKNIQPGQIQSMLG